MCVTPILFPWCWGFSYHKYVTVHVEPSVKSHIANSCYRSKSNNKPIHTSNNSKVQRIITPLLDIVWSSTSLILKLRTSFENDSGDTTLVSWWMVTHVDFEINLLKQNNCWRKYTETNNHNYSQISFVFWVWQWKNTHHLSQ